MELFRISNAKYANSLTSSGVANRWNYSNQWVIYTGASRSLSTLESVVHRSGIQTAFEYKVMVISVPDDNSLIDSVKTNQLPNNWREIEAYSILQRIGAEWYSKKSSLLLKVPSAIIPQESNYIINTRHPDFLEMVKLIRLEEYFFDHRLLM